MLWSSLGPMGTHRHGLGVAILEGPLYAVGGHDGWSYLNTVERYIVNMYEDSSSIKYCSSMSL